MTTCIANICGDSAAIILCADKELGLGHVTNTIGEKIITLHKSWRLMFAGDDTQPIFDIVDRAKKLLRDTKGNDIANPTTQHVRAAVTGGWRDELNARTEIKILGKRPGWTLERFFNEGKDHFTPADYARLIDEIEKEQFDLEIIVAGFDEAGKPEVLSASGVTDGVLNRGIGYAAIGSGAPNALTFLSWRETKPSTPLRGALAHVVEAKLQGEEAPVVSEETDVLIMRHNRPDIVMPEDVTEAVLFQKIAIPNRPQNIQHSQLMLLNDIAALNEAKLPYVWSDTHGRLTNVAFGEAKPIVSKPRRLRKAEGGAVIIGSTSNTILESDRQSPPSPKRVRSRPKP